jgi:hypothetical protein
MQLIICFCFPYDPFIKCYVAKKIFYGQYPYYCLLHHQLCCIIDRG